MLNDGVPLNPDILALKNKYVREKHELEEKAGELERWIAETEAENERIGQKLVSIREELEQAEAQHERSGEARVAKENEYARGGESMVDFAQDCFRRPGGQRN